MPSSIFRRHATDLIQHAISRAASAGDISHLGLRGTAREIAANDLLQPFLTSDYRIGTGKITDARGQQSDQTDLIIYSPHLLPPVLLRNDGADGIFPAEACFYSLEIKSKLTAKEMTDCVKKARRLRELDFCPGFYTVDCRPHTEINKDIFFCLFAFGSDLKSDPKKEIQRYARLDPEWERNPLISAICIAGVGCWFFRGRGYPWYYIPHTSNYDEVICFIAGIANTLSKMIQLRGSPRLGHYLLDDEPEGFTTIDGETLANPCRTLNTLSYLPPYFTAMNPRGVDPSVGAFQEALQERIAKKPRGRGQNR
jgi:hypothetical protein